MGNRGEIRSLTGIRGVAALFVVMYHRFDGLQMLDPVTRLIHHGYIAVDLFFILSGFVMALTYANSFQHGWTASAYGVFLTKRLGRVYPVYIVLTVLSAVYSLVNGQIVLVRVSLTPLTGQAGRSAPSSWRISSFPFLLPGFCVLVRHGRW